MAPACKRPLDEVVLLEAGQRDHLGLRARLADGLGRGGPVHARHDQIHQHDVGARLGHRPQRPGRPLRPRPPARGRRTPTGTPMRPLRTTAWSSTIKHSDGRTLSPCRSCHLHSLLVAASSPATNLRPRGYRARVRSAPPNDAPTASARSRMIPKPKWSGATSRQDRTPARRQRPRVDPSPSSQVSAIAADVAAECLATLFSASWAMR